MRSHRPHISTRFADQEASVHRRLASSHRTEKTEMDSFLPKELFEQQCSGYKDVYHDLEHILCSSTWGSRGQLSSDVYLLEPS